MPYSTIHWIKLEKRLLNDYRFYSMSEESQLIYVKILMLAAETSNKIPKNNGLIKSALRSKQSDNKIEECINEIKTNFPKFKENKGFYFFKEWGTRCNWIVKKELPKNSEGTPKDSVDKNRIDKIIEEYIRVKKYPTILPNGEKDKGLLSSLYKRNCKVAKDLVLISNGDTDKVIKAMAWFGGICDKKSLSWSLETILKWYPEYLIRGEKEDKYAELFK